MRVAMCAFVALVLQACPTVIDNGAPDAGIGADLQVAGDATADDSGPAGDVFGADMTASDLSASDLSASDLSVQDLSVSDLASTDAHSLDAAAVPGLIVVEAEDFAVNEYWARCPGCGAGTDDRSAQASAGGHLCTYEDNSAAAPASQISHTVTLPHAATYYVWGRSVRTQQERAWSLSVAGQGFSAVLGTQSVWQLGGSFVADSTEISLQIADASPDAFWAYPDAIILSDDPAFDPTLCFGGGAHAADCVPRNHPPVIEMPRADTVRQAGPYTLDARASDPDGDSLSFVWQQTSGPSVGSFDLTSGQTVVQIPERSETTQFVFQVEVSDGQESTAASITVTYRQGGIQFETRSCAEIQHEYECVEVTDCGFLAQDQRYYLLTQDISSPQSCLITTDDVVIDLNGYSLTFDQGYDAPAERNLRNGGFEQSDLGATSVDGWDFGSAPGAEVRSAWTMPLVGDRVLFVPGNHVIVSDWVTLPQANRSYRGQIVQRRRNVAVNVVVERETAGGVEQVCSRSTTDGLGGGKAAFCNFHGQPTGRYRLRVSSADSQFYDQADILPALGVGIGATGFFSSYDSVNGCLGDDGTCNMPDYSGTGAPTSNNGNIEIRNGTIIGGSVSMRSHGVFVRRASLTLNTVVIRTQGVAAKTISATGRADIANALLEADMPWVVDREAITETSATVGSNSSVIDSTFIGGQGNLSFSSSNSVVVRNNQFYNRATVTNHYAIAAGSSEDLLIENNTFNCDVDAADCLPFSGSGILFYRSRNSRITGNTFYIESAPCDAEYLDGIFTTNAIRLTDYNASPGASNGVFGNEISGNTFVLDANNYAQMPDCLAAANGIFYSVGAGDNHIRDNHFDSTNRSTGSLSVAFYIGAADNGGVWQGNTVRSNDKVAWYSSRYGPASNGRFIANTFERVDNSYYTPTAPAAAIRLGYCCGNEANDLHLLNNTWSGGYDADTFWFTSNQAADYSYAMAWFLDVTVTDATGQPIAGAQVNLDASADSDSGSTDSAGQVRLQGVQYRQNGVNQRAATTANRVEVTPHTLGVSAAGYQASSQTLNMDQERSVTVVLQNN